MNTEQKRRVEEHPTSRITYKTPELRILGGFAQLTQGPGSMSKNADGKSSNKTG